MILVLVQSQGDLIYALEYSLKFNTKVKFLLLNFPDLTFNYLNKHKIVNHLFINIELTILNIKNPISIYRALRDLNKYKYLLKDLKQVVFFSKYFDWFTAGLLKKIGPKTKIVYIPHFDRLTKEIVKSSSIKLIKYTIINKIYSLITGVKFKHKNKIRFIEFELNNFKNEFHTSNIKPNKVLNTNYIFKPSISSKKSLLLICDNEEWSHFNNAEEVFEQILKYADNYYVLAKSHPLHNLPEIIKNKSNEIIPNYLPIELINLNNIKIFVGSISSALGHFVMPNQKIYSVINLLIEKESDTKLFYKNYLQKINPKILFTNSHKIL